MNKSKDRTSVVLLCKNQHENLPLILHSLNHQTKKPDEVIIVDDQSDTDISRLAKHFGCRYVSTNVHTTQGKSGGRALARQLGSEDARFDLVAYLDGDIVPSRRFIEIGCKYALNNAVAKAPRRYRISMQGQIIQNRFDKVDRRISFSNFFSDSFVIKRGLVFDVGGWDEQFKGWGGEDVEFAYRVEKSCVPIVLVNGLEFYGTHIEHPIDHEANFHSLTKNANYFVAKHEMIQTTMGEYWKSMNIHLSAYWKVAKGVGKVGPR